MTELEQLTAAYIEATLWSSNDESRPDGGDPLDDNYGPDDLSPATREQMERDCSRFYGCNRPTIAIAERYGVQPKTATAWEKAGHDFWFTRNGHGVGFWDGDWPEPWARILDRNATAFGEFNLYVGDNGRIDH